MCNLTNVPNDSKWVQEFVISAQRFDLMSEVLLNEYMCTDVCPCLEYNNETQYNNPQFIYDRILEPKLRSHRRTNAAKSFAEKNGLIPFNWTSDEGIGFKTFKECYKSYAIPRAISNQPQLNEVFKFNKTVYQETAGKFTDTGPWEKKSKTVSLTYFTSHLNEIDVY